MESDKPVVPHLIWNFLLANAATNVIAKAEKFKRQRLLLANIMPAIMSTRPSSIASANAWSSAVTALQKVASRKSTDEDSMKESVDKVLAAGEVQEPADTPPKPSCLTGWDQSQKPTGKVSN
ncbi:TPA: hypothetical protein ACH3X1_015393 [Trebouxia sp. C0004]